MGKQTAQGTRWESRIRDEHKARGYDAERLAKRGIKGEPDVRLEGNTLKTYLPAVFWENWIGKKGRGRRRAKRMVIMDYEDFKKLFDTSTRYGILVQAKSTQTLSVRRVLEDLEKAIEEIGETS